jgi:hypothetical protein
MLLKAGLLQVTMAETLGRPQTYMSAVEMTIGGLIRIRELCTSYNLSFVAFEERIKVKESKRPPLRRPRRT